jgi:DNA-binding PadR family transcriptional regulator
MPQCREEPVSVRHGLLTLLAAGPSYGYQLRARLEEQTGGTWPMYEITAAGRDAVAAWFRSPVGRTAPARDELAIKLALAVGSPIADIRDVIQVQRSATMRAMQEYARLKNGTDPLDDLSWLLVLDGLVFQAEAEIRWLDHCEARLARAAAVGRPAPASQPTDAPEVAR